MTAVIVHGVFLKLAPTHDAGELDDVMAGLGALCAALPGCTGFEHGPNRDFERKSQGYPYGFVCRFDTADALADYAQNPTHKALGARLCALCEGGADGILVFDLEVA